MQTPKEQSTEMATFCRLTDQQPKRNITQNKIGKTVLQGILVALLAVSTSSGGGDTPDRSGPWTRGS